MSARAETPPKDVLDLVDRQIRLLASGYWTWGTTCKILVIVLFVGCFLAGLPHVAELFRTLAR